LGTVVVMLKVYCVVAWTVRLSVFTEKALEVAGVVIVMVTPVEM
jgi:hypothetical protein